MTTDLSNQRFGKLIALYPTPERKNGYTVWRCVCDCGNETSVAQSCLLRESTKSCGCLADPTKHKHYVEGTCLEMLRNKKTLNKNNTSGVRGVYPVRNGIWAAQIGFKGRISTLVALRVSRNQQKPGEKLR